MYIDWRKPLLFLTFEHAKGSTRTSKALSASWEGISPARPRTAWQDNVTLWKLWNVRYEKNLKIEKKKKLCPFAVKNIQMVSVRLFPNWGNFVQGELQEFVLHSACWSHSNWPAFGLASLLSSPRQLKSMPNAFSCFLSLTQDSENVHSLSWAPACSGTWQASNPYESRFLHIPTASTLASDSLPEGQETPTSCSPGHAWPPVCHAVAKQCWFNFTLCKTPRHLTNLQDSKMYRPCPLALDSCLRPNKHHRQGCQRWRFILKKKFFNSSKTRKTGLGNQRSDCKTKIHFCAAEKSHLSAGPPVKNRMCSKSGLLACALRDTKASNAKSRIEVSESIKLVIGNCKPFVTQPREES